MRLNYSKITIWSFMEFLPDYTFICDGDRKEIIIKEKTKDEKNRWYVIYKNYVSFNNVYSSYIYLFNNR